MKIILGTAQFGLNYGLLNKNGKIHKNECEKIIKYCINNKIYTFDSAYSYGSSLSLLKEYKNLYNNIKIINKINHINELDDYNYDIILIHNYKFYNKNIINFIKNKSNKIGVSIYTIEEAIIALNDENIDIIQIPFNILDTRWFKKNINKLLYKKEIYVRSIFLQGLLLNEHSYWNNYSNIKEDYEKLLIKYNLTKLELCIKYIKSIKWIDKIIIGIDSYKQLNEIISIYNNIDQLFNKDDIKYIINIFKNVDNKLLDPRLW